MFQSLRPGMPRRGPADTAALIVPGTAFHNVSTLAWGYRCRPFKDLARRIQQAKRTRAVREGMYRQCIKGTAIMAVQARRIISLALRKAAPICAAHRLLPLRFGREAPALAGFLAQPGRIGARIRMIDQHNRMIRTTFRRLILPPCVPSGPRERVNQTITTPRILIGIRRPVPRRCNEGRILRIRDQCFGDRIS